MHINKGDIILICILLATFMIFGATEFNIFKEKCWMKGDAYEQFSEDAWMAFTAIFGGELLTFALYKVGKAKYSSKNEKEEESPIEEEEKEQDEDEWKMN